MERLPDGGAMVAVEAGEDEIRESLAGREGVAVAAVNGPQAVVVSGDGDAVGELVELWKGRGRRAKRLAVSHAFHSPLMEPMLDEFRAVVEGLSFSAPLDPRRVEPDRRSRRSAGDRDRRLLGSPRARGSALPDGVATLAAHGVACHLELGPDGVLTAMAETCLAEPAGGPPPALATVLRGGRPEAETLLAALGAIHVRGAEIDWAKLFDGARPVPLPTYAFQRERYWLQARGGAGDVAAAGLKAADHPLLGASVALAGGDGALLTGRLSLAAHPWLADHTVHDTVMVPGTAFVELALKAGAEVGCERIEELTLEAPLVLAGDRAVSLQVAVGAPDDSGRRELSVHSRGEAERDGEAGAAGWTRHATGSLTEAAPAVADAAADLAAWPPDGATPVAVGDLYDRVAEAGFSYGPVFQGLRAAWRRDGELFAEVELAEEQVAEAGRFAIHPALLDAVLHTAFLDEADGDTRLPFSWSDVAVAAHGASSLRVRVVVGKDGISVAAADQAGAPVAAVGALATRAVERGQIEAAGGGAANDLYRLGWVPVAGRSDAAGGEPAVVAKLGALAAESVPADAAYADLDALLAALDAGDPVPALVLAEVAADPRGGDDAAAARAAAAAALAVLQRWLAEPRLADARLALVTRGAVAAAAAAGEEPDLAGAAVWGLVRTAQSEHPDRFALVDVDGSPPPGRPWPARSRRPGRTSWRCATAPPRRRGWRRRPT